MRQRNVPGMQAGQRRQVADDHLSQATNHRDVPGVIPADKQPTRKGIRMFGITLKRSAATLGVVAGLLAAAGPASAQSTDRPRQTASSPIGSTLWGRGLRSN